MPDWLIYVLIITGSIIVLLIILLFIFAFIVYRNTLIRKKPFPLEGSSFERAHPEVMTVRKQILNRKWEDVYIKSKDGLKLHAYYFKCPKETHKTIINVHGWYGNALDDVQFTVSNLFDEYNILLPDLRAHGLSEGKYIGFSILDKDDILLWCDYISEKDNEATIAISGCSMGGATVMMIASSVKDNVKALIEDCGFYDAWDTLVFAFKFKFVPRGLILNLLNMYSKMLAHYDLKKNKAIDSLKNTNKPILFIHGDQDKMVSVNACNEAFAICCSSKKEKHIFEDTTHAMSHLGNREIYEKMVKEFLDKYM